MKSATSPVFELAYVGLTVTDIELWSDFAARVLCTMVVPRSSGIDLRLDARSYRIRIEQGEADALAYVGWGVTDLPALEAARDRLSASGVNASVDSDLAAQRGVQHLLRFVDPGGVRTELVVGPIDAETPFHSQRAAAGFHTGDLGLGHLTLTCRTREESERFYREVLGFKLSDRIVTTIGELELDLVFLHVNPRHHSLALGGPQPKGMHHLMIEFNSIDDLGRAFDRASRAGCVVTTFGKHPNDRMLSFYVHTPSGFQMELGWGGVQVDDSDWSPCTYDRLALWGHHYQETS